MKEMLQLDLSRALIEKQDLNVYKKELEILKKRFWSEEEDFTGWVQLPFSHDKNELKRILSTAEKIRKQCEIFIVIGIGGSYLGAKAAISALAAGGSTPEIFFAGQNLSGTYHKELLEKIRDKEICLCVISKSGTTTEPSVAFSILKDELYKKYGREEAANRIYAITDAKKGILRQEVDREGYESFVVPDDIGGRYSVLTPVGLLPIAVAGIDVEEMLLGAKSAAEKIFLAGGEGDKIPNAEQMDDASLLAAARVSLLNRGNIVEVYEYYEPRLQYFAEWLKQLFGESEGKNGKGIFPTALQFSTDLHSMGQFLQDGNKIFFETVLNVLEPPEDLVVPESAGALLAGKSMNSINQAAVQGVIAAHEAEGIPIIKLDIPKLTPYCFGQLFYFFESSCALSGYLMGVNPFDQPGVESYKSEMRKVLQGRQL
jgi:glucose-6-phosphate isomerase